MSIMYMVCKRTIERGSYPENMALRVNVRTDEGQPWKCVQAHTHHGDDGWNPAAASARALWAPYHATRREYALPYVPTTNAEDAYKAGEWMIWTDGLAYRCLGNAVTFGPDLLPDAWEIADQL